MAGEQLKYGIRITADGSVAVAEAGKTEQALKKIGDQAEQSSIAAGRFGLAIGAAAALGATAFVGLLKQSVATAAAFDDLAESTGSTVEQLSSLANNMAVSGVDFNVFSGLINKLAVGLSGVDDEGGKAGKALAALGVQSKDPATAMRELALSLDQYADGANKAALLTAIFGRGAAQYAGALKDLARDAEMAASVTGTFAAEAEKLEKSMARLKVETDAWVTLIASGLVPTLNDWLENVRNAHAAGLGWFKSFIVGTTYSDELVGSVERLNKRIVEAKANLQTEPGFNGIMGWLQTTPEELAALNREMAVLLGMLAKSQQGANGDQWDRYLMGVQGMPAGGQKPDAPTLPGAASKTKAAVDYYVKGLGDIADALKAEDEARKKTLEGYRQQLELIDKLYEAQTKSIEGIAKETEGYQKHINSLTLTKDELYALDIAKLQAIVDARTYEGYLNLETEALIKQLDTLKQLRSVESTHDASEAAKKAAEEWQRAADSIGNSLSDALLRGFESGKDWARNFVDTLKNMFGTLVLRPVIQAIVAPAAGGITSMFSGSASASGGGGASSLFNLGGGSWLSGLGDSIFGAGGGSAFGAGFSSPFSTLAEIFGGGAEFASGGMALASGLGAAVPIIGGVLAISSLVKGILDSKKGGPKSGGFASSGLIGALPGSDGGRWFTPNSADADVQAITSATSAAFKQALAALGGSGAAGFALGFDTDPQGSAPNRLHAGSYVNGRQVYDAALGDLGRDDAALQAALELESKRALLAALQASDLPQQIAAVFDSISASGASADAIDNLLAFGTAMKTVIDAIGGSVVADAQTAWEASQRSSVEVLRDMGAEVIRLAGEVDGTAGSMQALAAATGDYRSAVVQTLVAIKQVAAQMTELFSGTRTSLTTFGMSAEQLYNFYRTDADAAYAELATTTDPARVADLAQRINADINAGFSALGDEGKTAMKNPLLDYLNGVDAFVQGRLATISADVSSSTADPFAAANAALDSAASRFGSAAGQQQDAAAQQQYAAAVMQQAAQTMLQAVRTPVQAYVVSHEVNG